MRCAPPRRADPRRHRRRRLPPAGRCARRPRRLGWTALLALTLALGGAAACRSAVPWLAPGAPDAEPWRLPAGELATQRLLRVAYDGPDGEGSFKLTLRLAADGRYQARAVDPFGRALWTLDATDDGGLWIDHRAEAACRLAGRLDVAAARLTPFPLAALPALLLGRLPAAPAGAVERDGDRLDFRDAEDRRWTARLAAGAPAAWTLWADGEPALWWRAGDGEASLSDRRRKTQLRWRQVVREALDGSLETAAVPAGYALVDCAQFYR